MSFRMCQPINRMISETNESSRLIKLRGRTRRSLLITANRTVLRPLLRPARGWRAGRIRVSDRWFYGIGLRAAM